MSALIKQIQFFLSDYPLEDETILEISGNIADMVDKWLCDNRKATDEETEAIIYDLQQAIYGEDATLQSKISQPPAAP